MYGWCDIKAFNGKTLKSYNKTDDAITFTFYNGDSYVMRHDQDCCENVWLEDVCGDLDDLLGMPIIVAEERFEDVVPEDDYGIKGWTFYELATVKGSVTLRWCGESNGYYSIHVNITQVS